MPDTLASFFGKKDISLPISQPLSGDIIHSYLHNLEQHDRDRLDDEIRNRGLSFGDLRVDNAFGMSITFRTPYEKTGEISLDAVKEALQSIIVEQDFVGIAVQDGRMSDEVNLLLTEDAPESLKGVCKSGWSDGESYQQKVFLEAKKLSGHPLCLETFSPEAIDVALLLASRLGLEIEPATYANESNVPLSEIVEHALVWHDRDVDKHYIEVRYNADLAKSCVYIGGGWNRDYEEDGKKIVVLASGHSAQKFKLNNVIVPATRVESPTHFMQEARDYIRDYEDRRNTCGVDGCEREAINEVSVTRFEINDGFGSSSFGSIYRVCNDPEHVEQIKAQAGGIQATVRLAQIETW